MEERFFQKHPRLIIILWIAISLALAFVGYRYPAQTQIPGPAAKEALLAFPGEQFAFQNGIPPRDLIFFVLHSTSLSVDDADFSHAREEFVGVLKSAQSPYGNNAFREVRGLGHNKTSDTFFVSTDKRSCLFIAETTSSLDEAAKSLVDIPHLIRDFRLRFPRFSLAYIGDGTLANEIFSLIDRDLDRSLIFTLPLTFLVLCWAFGSLATAFLPLVIALFSLIASLGAAAIVSHAFGPINATASQLVVLLVLALGVDYSLFVVARVREEKRRGRGHEEAVILAKSTTGRTVLWSGVTVALSLFGLFFMNDTVLRSMAVVSIIAVVITALGSVVVLPSILLLANNLTRPKRTSEHRQQLLETLLRYSLRHPVLVVLFVGGSVLALGVFARDMELGSTIDPSLLPGDLESNAGRAMLEKEFPGIKGTEFSIIVKGDKLDSIRFEDDFQSFLDELNEAGDIRGPIAVSRNDSQTAARYTFLANGNANSPEMANLVGAIRESLLPSLFQNKAIEGFLSGRLPYIIDDAKGYRNRTPLVFASVLLLSSLLLLLAFRSVVIPVKAILLNCLSTFASFGVMVFVFQSHGPFPWHYSVIEGFVPGLLFSILFGLSMDYHLLLLGRIREEYLAGKGIDEAIVQGVSSTSGAITSAALIMVCVFGIIACLELPVMKELGVGLSVAVALDATVIRTLLLPASMQLLGDWNWYLPRSLRWLPDFQITEKE